MFDEIEKLKQDLTDKYVVVDASVPELMRFNGHVGQVKTVNMSGRALVQFEAWNNIGWYDIEVDFLKVVPKPEAAVAGKQHEAKPDAAAKPAAPSGEKKLSPLEMARMQGAAKGAAAAPAGEKPVPAEKPAAAPGAKKSTADILAAVRAKNTAASTAEATATAPAPAAVESAAKPAAAAAAVAQPKPAASKPALTSGQRPSISEILAWCREHDAK